MSNIPYLVQRSNLQFKHDFNRYEGKVRDVYDVFNHLLIMVVSDRISAFDVVFKELIPHKGQTLNQLSAFFLQKTRSICPNWWLASPHPNISVGLKCDPYPIEMIVRGRLCGHSWRQYQAGERIICGAKLPDGLQENDVLPQPVITPTTKSKIGHDIDITPQEITKSGLIDAEEYARMEYYAIQLFDFGQKWALEKGLILADTKFEFGYKDFEVILIDEILTPDSSRYFILDGFEERQKEKQPQPQFSKEHLRKWLISVGYQGQEDTSPPTLSPQIINELSQKYISVYEQLTGDKFIPNSTPVDSPEIQDIVDNIMSSY